MGGFTPAAIKVAKDTKITASDVLIIQDTTVRNTVNTAYTKLIAFTVKTAVLSATCRTVFTLKGSSDIVTVYGRLYLDGVALGAERIVSSAAYQTFTEDLNLQGSGHVIELYLKTQAGATVYTNEFSIKGDSAETELDWEQTYP